MKIEKVKKGYAISIKSKKECCGCGACADICPKSAIQMKTDKEGFSYPYVDKKACINCGQCVQVCPLKNSDRGNYEQLYIGLQAKNEEIRYSSSSGGAFSILAQYIFEKEGVVYGAGYSRHMQVKHRKVTCVKELEYIKRTKYVQSDLGGVFQSIRTRLENDQWVLFCGTACQAQALRLFLDRPYDKLVVVDLICYGVPSPGIWREYVKYIEHKHNGKVSEFYFRDKRNKDNGRTCSYKINGVEYAESLNDNIFCKMYFLNYILRPSCYECRFCLVNRESDFTIGDFWGSGNVRPDMEDGMGTSAVIVRTEKAKTIWEQIKDEVQWFECKEEEFLQPRLLTPTKRPKTRWLFMILCRIMSFPLIAKLITYVSKLRRILKHYF